LIVVKVKDKSVKAALWVVCDEHTDRKGSENRLEEIDEMVESRVTVEAVDS
jgi:hypothetical protein